MNFKKVLVMWRSKDDGMCKWMEVYATALEAVKANLVRDGHELVCITKGA